MGTQALDQPLYGKPQKIRIDNGPEFVTKLAREWNKANGINRI